MKIVQIITRSDNIGGAQTHVRDLSIELNKSGCDVTLLVGGNGSFIDELNFFNIRNMSIPHLIQVINPYYDLRAFLEIRKILKKIQPNIVATHSSKAGILGRFAAWSLGIPSVFTAHGWVFSEELPKFKLKIYILYEKLIGFITSKIITVSKYDLDLCLKYNIVSQDKVVTIHNGIKEAQRPTSIQNVSTPIFVMTARLERPKNHVLLLKALSKLKEYQWKILFIGEGPLRPQIEQLISQLSLEKRVNLLGERKDVAHLLKSAQGFILTSNKEGLPISILEAMRAGLPVIASDVGGIPELVEDGVNGYLIPKDNVNILIDRLSILFRNKDLRSKMGDASYKKYNENFKISQMLEQTLRVYKQAIEG